MAITYFHPGLNTSCSREIHFLICAPPYRQAKLCLRISRRRSALLCESQVTKTCSEASVLWPA